ncbi:DUF4190 domain-containing protein [Streptomyces sp. ISL-43]|uniref:DUF4190 domain-containing protein n=1 Tax=Streptomyces sp. ISL-43 TaxID=2819183 RepID=UPI001BEB8A16|nr:DUF4190 domain-containing protein [Streptomyces sp. ISL-43]MBT2452223.1 DUF4190 domain-containing protein [Streptomyces sp. ISL-43]
MSIPPPPPPEPDPQWGPRGQAWQPGDPPGWNAPPAPAPMSQRTNVLAIVAFVMSIVCAIPLVPLILGIVALNQIRERGENGKGLAIAAIVIHSMTLVFYAFVLVAGLSGVLDDAPKRDTGGQVTAPGSSELENIRTGDCFNTEDDLAQYNDKDAAEAAPSVRIVPCDQPHKGEVYAVFDLEDGVYPGTERLVSSADESCGSTALTDYAGPATKLPAELNSYYYFPSSDTWTLGDRQVTCFLGDPGGPSTGSVRASVP